MKRLGRIPRRSALGEALLNLTLRPTNSWWERVLQRIARRARAILTRIWDPAVLVKVGDRPILMPLSHELPGYLARHPLYGKNIGLLAAAIEKEGSAAGRGFVLDVGANVGDTAAVISNYSSIPVLCVEPHPVFSAYLEANWPKLPQIVGVESAFVGSMTRQPQGQWVTSKGTARFHVGSGTESPAPASLGDLVRRHQDVGPLRALKLDTDGYDLEILLSETEFLARWKPVVFLEYDPSFYRKAETSLVDLVAHLLGLDYQSMQVFDNYGGFLGAIRLVNSERVDEIEAYAKSLATHHSFLDICVFHAEHARLERSYRELLRTLHSVGS